MAINLTDCFGSPFKLHIYVQIESVITMRCTMSSIGLWSILKEIVYFVYCVCDVCTKNCIIFTNAWRLILADLMLADVLGHTKHELLCPLITILRIQMPTMLLYLHNIQTYYRAYGSCWANSSDMELTLLFEN